MFCTETAEQREQWITAIKVDPETNSKIASYHMQHVSDQLKLVEQANVQSRIEAMDVNESTPNQFRRGPMPDQAKRF